MWIIALDATNFPARFIMEAQRLQDQIDEVRLLDNGAEREDLTKDEYEKVRTLLDLQDAILEKIRQEERIQKRNDMRDESSGSLPRDPITTGGEWRSFGEFIQCAINSQKQGTRPDPRLFRAISGLGETIPSSGGFLVSQDFSNDILDKTFNTGEILRRVRRFPISANSNAIKIPAVDETARTSGNRVGGVRGYWTEEGGSKTASTPKFRLITLDPFKLTGLVYLTDELVQDEVAIGAFCLDAFTKELVFWLRMQS